MVLLLVVGLVIAAAAFLVGPSVTAVRTRHAVKSGIDWLRSRGEQAGLPTGPVSRWTSGISDGSDARWSGWSARCDDRAIAPVDG